MLLFLLLLSSLIQTDARAGAVSLERLEASVNSQLILSSDLRRFRKTVDLRSQLDPLFAGTSIAAQGAKATHRDLIEFLIDERIIAQQFPVTDAEVEQEINSIQATNKIDRPQLRQALTEQGFTFEDYFELIRISAAKRNLIDREIRTKVSITDHDAKNYFYNHYVRSKAAGLTYRLRLISVNPANYKNAAAAREVAARALRDIRGGEAFEEVAKRVSDDPTREQGGDLGTLSEDALSPAIREQTRKLKIGEVTPVFGSPSSAFLVVKLVDIVSADTEKFEKMKEEIRNQLAASEYQHQISLWIERQRQTAFIHRAGEKSLPGAAGK